MAKGFAGVGVGIGTVVKCDSQDKSMYCQTAKLFNILIWVMVLFFLGKFALEYIKKK